MENNQTPTPDYTQLALDLTRSGTDPAVLQQHLGHPHPMVALAAKRALNKAKGPLMVGKLLVTQGLHSNGQNHLDVLYFHLPNNWTQDPNTERALNKYARQFEPHQHHYPHNTIGYVSYLPVDPNGGEVHIQHESLPMLEPGWGSIQDLFGATIQYQNREAEHQDLLQSVQAYLGADLSHAIQDTVEQIVGSD